MENYDMKDDPLPSSDIPAPPMDFSDILTNELLDELMTRFDHIVMEGMLVTSDTGGKRMVKRWKGCSHTCAGMALDMSHTVLTAFDADSTEADPDDLGD